MIKLLRFLWTGSWHDHKWKIIQKTECRGDCGERWTRFYLRCETCGWVRYTK